MNSHSIAETLRQPEIFSLAEQAVRDYIDWDQLAHLPLPPGLTLAETWELLGTIRQFGATWFPVPALDRRQFWYGLTREGTNCLRFMDHHCRTGSAVDLLMRGRENHHFLVRSRISEAIATCRLDGIEVSPVSLARMLYEGRSAQDAGEQLVHNTYTMLGELDDLVDEPFSEELVQFLYERLTRGVDLQSLPSRGVLRTNLAGTLNIEPRREEARRRGVLQSICDYANGKIGDPSEPTPLRAYMILHSMGYWRLLPDFNDTIARHMYRLFAVKRQYPVLGYLPTSVMTVRWFEGSLPEGVTRFAHIARHPVVPGSIDGTEDILTHLQLAAAALGELLGYIELAEREDNALEEALATAPLNYRQRSVLARALADPGSEFRIRQHQTTHRVVYRTARTDLVELMDRGYLTQELEGKALVFRPVSGLREMIEGRCELPRSFSDPADSSVI